MRKEERERESEKGRERVRKEERERDKRDKRERVRCRSYFSFSILERDSDGFSPQDIHK